MNVNCAVCNTEVVPSDIAHFRVCTACYESHQEVVDLLEVGALEADLEEIVPDTSYCVDDEDDRANLIRIVRDGLLARGWTREV